MRTKSLASGTAQGEGERDKTGNITHLRSASLSRYYMPMRHDRMSRMPNLRVAIPVAAHGGASPFETLKPAVRAGMGRLLALF